MTNKEAIEEIRSCLGVNNIIEPYSDEMIAFGMAIEALQKQATSDKASDKYRWHDLRRNPDDLPNNSEPVIICAKGFEGNKLGVQVAVHSKLNHLWGTDLFSLKDGEVIAWREIEPFEEE